MPIYEFECQKCHTKFSELVGLHDSLDTIICPQCKATQVQKLISKFRRGRSEDDRLSEVSDRLESMSDPDSGQATRELVREMGKALDEDFSDEAEEMFEEDMDGGAE